MKQTNTQEIENVNIKDLSILRNNKNVLLFFKSINIETLKDLLNCDDIYNLIIDSRINEVTKNEARGLIELIRYKYLGEPLVVDSILDNNIKIKNLKEPNEYFEFGEVNLDRLGFNAEERNRIIRYLTMKKINGEYYVDSKNQATIGSIIEILTALLKVPSVNKFSLGMKEKIEIYRQAYYDKENVATNMDKIEIENIKDIIKQLTKKVTTYQTIISNYQKRLDELENRQEGKKL